MVEKQLRFLIRLTCFAACAALVWLFLRYLLVWLLPFFLALGLASLAEPLIERVRRSMHLQRSFLAAAFTLALSAALVGLKWQSASDGLYGKSSAGSCRNS